TLLLSSMYLITIFWSYKLYLPKGVMRPLFALLADLSHVYVTSKGIWKSLLIRPLLFRRPPNSPRSIAFFKSFGVIYDHILIFTILVVLSIMTSWVYGIFSPQGWLWTLSLLSLSLPYFATIFT